MVCLEMGSSIKASVVSILKEPGGKSATTGIELFCRSEDVQENPLHGLFRLAVIPQYGSGRVEHQCAVPFEQDCQGVVTSRAQRLHKICIRECSKPGGRAN